MHRLVSALAAHRCVKYQNLTNLLYHAFRINHVLSLCMLGNFHDFLSAVFFSNPTFFLKNSFSNTIRLSNSLDPDQDRHSVGPDLGANCLQRLSTDDKSQC